MRASMRTCILIGCLGVGVAGGCETIEENPRTSGTLIGGAAGAGVGAAVAGDDDRAEGALIGGAVGAGAGWLAGDQADKHNDRDDRRRERIRRERDYDDDIYYQRAREARYRDRYDSDYRDFD